MIEPHNVLAAVAALTICPDRTDATTGVSRQALAGWCKPYDIARMMGDDYPDRGLMSCLEELAAENLINERGERETGTYSSWATEEGSEWSITREGLYRVWSR